MNKAPNDTSHSVVIRDHPFEPRDPAQPWGKCKHCWGFEGTHEQTTLKHDGPRPPYRCPRCVELGTEICTHAPEVVDQFLKEPKEERPTPFPVAEISLEEMQEYAVKKEPEDLTCWRCGSRDGVRKLAENGAILCPACEQILKP
jgi:Zn finger protein HypA/HybF involved in hydrogenase expression